MPRSLKVVVSCDYCPQEIDDEDHEGSLALTINGKGPRQMDLCDDCMTSLSPRDLLSVFEGLSDIPKQPRPPATRGRSEVQRCGLCDTTSPTSQGLGRHTKAAHGLTVAEMRQAAEVMHGD
jgi:hypothetical protein